MTTFTINDQNEIVAFATPEEAVAATATPFDTFASQKELSALATSWPKERPVAIWNSLAGVTPVKKFSNHQSAAARIWTRIQGLSVDKMPEQQAKPKAAGKPKSGARPAKGAPAKAKVGKRASTVKHATHGKDGAKRQGATSRDGSKTAQVVAMLQRKDGASLVEIMEQMGWQRHTVRGFMAGAMKKAGYAIESFKPPGGERAYRINS
jgi:hypothetical protein